MAHRASSNRAAGFSGRTRLQANALLFNPPQFNPQKLKVTFLPGVNASGPLPLVARRYTLTHNDISGKLNLSIGCSYSAQQLAGWYLRLLRDEVLAEWRIEDVANPTLHLFCHVSGEERWLAPPWLRLYIFQREMPLVLHALRHGDRELLKNHPELASASVLVHLASHIKELDRVVPWGTLSQPSTWLRPPFMLRGAVSGSAGWAEPALVMPRAAQRSQQGNLLSEPRVPALGQASKDLQTGSSLCGVEARWLLSTGELAPGIMQAAEEESRALLGELDHPILTDTGAEQTLGSAGEPAAAISRHLVVADQDISSLREPCSSLEHVPLHLPALTPGAASATHDSKCAADLGIDRLPAEDFFGLYTRSAGSLSTNDGRTVCKGCIASSSAYR